MNEDLKKRAAVEAVGQVREGMIVGLGTGSTAAYFIRELGARVRMGLEVNAIPTSLDSERIAREVGIPLTTFQEHPSIDITVDGADEVSPALDLVKGLGGALVREKIVARASKRVVIIVDESKLVDRLGSKAPIPIEVLPFAVPPVSFHLERMGGRPIVRETKGIRFVSDNGNHMIDWHCGPIEDPLALEREIKWLAGVIDCGIFSGIASIVIVAGTDGIRTLTAVGRG